MSGELVPGMRATEPDAATSETPTEARATGVMTQPPEPPGKSALAWLRAHLAYPLERNAYALVLNAGVTSLLGLGYWVVAARYYTPEQVGQNSALVSAMVLLSTCAQLNLMGAMTHFLPRAGDASGLLVRGAYAAAALVSAPVAVVFVLVAPRVSSELAFFEASWVLAAAFCLAVVVWGIFTIQDGVLTGLRSSAWVPVENAAFGVVKLILLVALVGIIPSFGIFVSWTFPLALALVLVNLLIFRVLIPRHAHATRGRAIPLRRGRIARFVGGDYLSSLFLQGSTTLLPVLVAGLLGADANARFYVAFVLVSAVDVMVTNIGSSLTVEGSNEPGRIPELARRTARLSFGLLLPAAAVVVVAAPLILSVFGSDYATSGTAVLRLLALGMVGKGLTILYVSICRAQGRVGRIVAVQGATCALVIGTGLALVGPVGLEGIGLGWLIGQFAVAVAVLPGLNAALRGRPGQRQRVSDDPVRAVG